MEFEDQKPKRLKKKVKEIEDQLRKLKETVETLSDEEDTSNADEHSDDNDIIEEEANTIDTAFENDDNIETVMDETENETKIELKNSTTFCLCIVVVVVVFALLGIVIYFVTIQRSKQVTELLTEDPDIWGENGCSANSFMIADGVCDEITNRKRCLYDGGDCCLANKSIELCKVCTCKLGVDERQMLDLFRDQNVHELREASEFEAATQSIALEVTEVLNVHVCSVLCTDTDLEDRINSWHYAKTTRTCKCTIMKETEACSLGSGQLQVVIGLRSEYDIPVSGVGFVQAAKFTSCGCLEKDLALVDSNDHGLATTNELSTRHCKNECQSRSNCTFFSFKYLEGRQKGSCRLTQHDIDETSRMSYSQDWISGSSFCHHPLRDTNYNGSMDFEGETNSLLIISGLPFDNGKTIVEEHVINGSEKSNTFVKDFSLTLYGGIGGALKFKDLDHPVPIYCGGTVSGSNDRSEGDKCRMYLNGQWSTQFPSMSSKRIHASAITILDRTTLFVIGGENDPGQYLKSTEFVTLEGSVIGPQMPKVFYGGCFVKIDEYKAIAAGGNMKETYIYSVHQSSWTLGPEVNKKRFISQSCGVLQDAQDETLKYVVMAGGKTIEEDQYLDSTEVWKINSDVWTQGPKLPLNSFEGSPIISETSGKSVLILGGKGYLEWSDEIFRLKCHNGNCEWSQTDLKLSLRRIYSTAFMVKMKRLVAKSKNEIGSAIITIT